MFNKFNAVFRGYRRLRSIFGTILSRIWKILFSVPEHRLPKHYHYSAVTNLSPLEEARLRHHGYWEMRQW